MQPRLLGLFVASGQLEGNPSGQFEWESLAFIRWIRGQLGTSTGLSKEALVFRGQLRVGGLEVGSFHAPPTRPLEALYSLSQCYGIFMGDDPPTNFPPVRPHKHKGPNYILKAHVYIYIYIHTHTINYPEAPM